MTDNDGKIKMKIHGRRKGFDSSPEAAQRWLETANELRGKIGICPRGVYRFSTFEEADRWMTQMLVQSFLAQQRSPESP